MLFTKHLFIALTCLTVLVACDSAEDRADGHYQRGLELIEEGDYDRAVVELRNVFKLVSGHKEARLALADLYMEKRREPRRAYREYLRLVEQFPDELDARVALSEMAFQFQSWEELERHGAAAEELDPDAPRVQAISAARAYRTAVLDEDNSARRTHARTATALKEDMPENAVLRSVVLDNHLRNGELTEALAQVDWLLERFPDEIRYLRQRLSILAQLQDFDAVEEQLRDMVTRFPDDDTHKATLIRYFMTRDEADKAEAFLRDLVADSEEGDISARVDLIRFLIEIRGEEAAQEEIAKATAEMPDESRFKVLAASIDFDAGRTEQAIQTIQEVLEGAEESDVNRDVKIALARMLLATGNEVGARARVEEVLAQDPSNNNALKLQARWLIEADNTDEAIAGLRIALDQAPEDVEALNLMAQAYSRAGRSELARDFLALAVNASGNAPTETVRYARLLISEERYLTAEDILLPALRLAPENIEILVTLGQLYMAMEDMGRVEQVSNTLRALDTPAALQAANGFDAERINRSSGATAAVDFLNDIAQADDATLASKMALVRARLGTGDPEGALTLAREIQAESPDNEGLQSMLAAMEALNGNLDTAQAIYESLLETDAQRPRVWLELSRIKQRQGDPESARELLDQGLEQTDDPNLLWAVASDHERRGEFDEAIGIYETLYAENSNSAVIANNLASLISTYRTDPENLEKAWRIARRLRDSEIPAFQDTYGWLLHRRGQSEEAVPYLESAARGLPQDALVHFHLGEAYLAVERREEALNLFRLAASIAGPADTREQIQIARERILELEQAIDSPPANE